VTKVRVRIFSFHQKALIIFRSFENWLVKRIGTLLVNVRLRLG
jgi:hypothetical protein